ncbi:hypothetical protein, partial [Roseateles puraquae]|uniref:hypothetical protein n=1 Tax=Roseateles puraquae TaxID=431059 RepID=UPI002407E739
PAFLDVHRPIAHLACLWIAAFGAFASGRGDGYFYRYDTRRHAWLGAVPLRNRNLVALARPAGSVDAESWLGCDDLGRRGRASRGPGASAGIANRHRARARPGTAAAFEL